VALGCIALVGCFASEVVRALLLGWVGFLLNVLPRVATDRPTLVLAGVAFGLFVVGIHGFGVAWRRRRAGDDGMARTWRPLWSLAAGAMAVVLFAAGISLVGIVHQTAWVATSDKPWYGSNLSSNEWRVGTRSDQHLKSFGLGLHNYHATYNHLPCGGTFTPEGEMLHSWETYLLPYMAAYSSKGFDPSLPWRDLRNVEFFRGIEPDFINPEFRVAELTDAEGFGLSHYAANARVMSANRGLSFTDITDGTANTIATGEVNANFQPWGHPINYRDPAVGINRPSGFGGPPSRRGVYFCMADGSVRLITLKTSRRVLHALATPAGGESVPVGAEELEP
jgi:hypothetical protein